jgi:hypothetical protein
MVAGTLEITPAESRALVIAHATEHGLALREVTRAVTDGTLAPADLIT